MSSNLKPCPFCGNEAPRICRHMDESLFNHDTVPWERVVCDNCDCGTRYVCDGEDATAAETWNARA